MRSFIAAACVLATIAGAARAEAKSEIVRVADVAEAFVKAADRVAPGVKWMAAKKTTSKEGVGYYLVGREARGKKRLVTVLGREDGERVAVRVDVAVASVPAAVTAALAKEHPDFTFDIAEACGPRVAQITCYRLVGKKGKANASFVVSLDGTRMIRE